jgi:hypothetical protein
MVDPALDDHFGAIVCGLEGRMLLHLLHVSQKRLKLLWQLPLLEVGQCDAEMVQPWQLHQHSCVSVCVNTCMSDNMSPFIPTKLNLGLGPDIKKNIAM